MSAWQIIQEDVLFALAELEKRGEKFDCVVMDPPYCSGGLLPQQVVRGGVSKYSKRTDLGDFEDGMSQLAFFHFMVEVFVRSKRVLNQPGYLFSFIDWRSYPVISEALEGGGGKMVRDGSLEQRTEPSESGSFPSRLRIRHRWRRRSPKDEELRRSCRDQLPRAAVVGTDTPDAEASVCIFKTLRGSQRETANPRALQRIRVRRRRRA